MTPFKKAGELAEIDKPVIAGAKPVTDMEGKQKAATMPIGGPINGASRENAR